MNTFSHDSNARNDERILKLRMKHKAAGYGVYFMILERMRDNSNFMCIKDYNVIAFDLREDAALIKSVVEDFGLFVFTEDGKYFYSESFLERMEKVNEVSRKRSESAKRRRTKKESEDIPGVTDPELPFPDADVQPKKDVVQPYVAPGLFNIEQFDKDQQEYFRDIRNTTTQQQSLCMKFKITPQQLLVLLNEFILDCKCRQNMLKSRKDANDHFNNWLSRRTSNKNNNETTNSNRRRGIEATASCPEEYEGAF